MPDAERTPRISRERRPYLVAAGAGALVFVAVAILVQTGALDGLDGRVFDQFSGGGGGAAGALARTLDRLDTWWLLALILAAIAGGLWWSGRLAQALYFGVTACVALTVNPLLKLAFERQPPSGGSGVEAAVYAFPSGHTTTATAAATALAVVFWPTRWRWPMLAAAVAFSLGMAVSRVSLGVHWLSDVIGGLALGFTIAVTVRAIVPWPSPQEAEAAARELAAAEGRAGGPVSSATRGAEGGQGIDVVFLDWGNTLMVDNGMREGPMKDWASVEAESGAQEALLRLRARYRLVVATNAGDSPAHLVRLALERVGLDEYVDDVVSSADVGDHKPHYAFFRAALLREGERGIPLDPRRAVMVGDGTTNDIAGAQRAGMRTIWYNPTKRRFPEGAKPPDAVVRRLSDLPATVDRLAGVEPVRRSRKQRRADAEAAAAIAAAAATRDLRAATAAEDAAKSAAAALPQAGPTAAAGAPGAPAPPPTER